MTAGRNLPFPALHLIGAADKLHRIFGNLIAWLTFAMALTTLLLVGLRYLVGGGNLILVQETVIYLHAITFMLGAGWTLGRNAHVRVDVFYRRWSKRTRAWIDALGTLVFLMPVAFFILFSSLDFVGQSWAIREASGDPGGIPTLYLLKSLIPTMAVLLILQGLIELVKNTLVLIGDQTDSTP